METIEQYTYDNWWNGEVTLVYATRYCEKEDEPILVDWANFSEADADKIKDMQWEIFAEGVNVRLKAVCAQFNQRYEVSEMKLKYFTDERQECWNVMFGEIPNLDLVPLNQWKISLGNKYLMEVQYYVERTLKNGIDDGLGFIHSPNCKYQDLRLPDSRIYARFVWEYFKWLESLIVKEEKVVSPAPKIESESAIPTQENIVESDKSIPQNPYPKIFTSIEGFKIFEAFKNEVITKSTEYAAYSYLFGMLKKDDFIHDLKHKKFIDFLAENYGATELAKKYIQLKYYENAFTKEKANAYSRIKKQFQ